ncbi:MAG: virion core protein, T7 gp14 family [Rhodospirillales bacterium]
MGAIELAALSALASTASFASGVQQSKAQAKAANRQAELQRAYQQQQYEQQKKALEFNRKSQQQELEDSRRRTLAQQRARYGASGVMPGSGSAAAVLSGLESQYARKGAEIDGATDLELEGMENKYLYDQQSSLLSTAHGPTGLSLAAGFLNLGNNIARGR